MRNKIFNITGCATCNEVLITIMRDVDSNDYVSIQAWHYAEVDDCWYYQIENIDFDNNSLMESYICDFSELSATNFAKSFEF
jgi:hypothetical protein